MNLLYITWSEKQLYEGLFLKGVFFHAIVVFHRKPFPIMYVEISKQKQFCRISNTWKVRHQIFDWLISFNFQFQNKIECDKNVVGRRKKKIYIISIPNLTIFYSSILKYWTYNNYSHRESQINNYKWAWRYKNIFASHDCPYLDPLCWVHTARGITAERRPQLFSALVVVHTRRKVPWSTAAS